MVEQLLDDLLTFGIPQHFLDPCEQERGTLVQEEVFQEFYNRGGYQADQEI